MTKQEIGLYKARTIQNCNKDFKNYIQIKPTSKNKDLSSIAYYNTKTSIRKRQITNI